MERVTKEALAVAGRISDDYEILIINDGSKDRTAEIADRLAKEYPAVRAIHHEVNKGYGGRFKPDLKTPPKSLFFTPMETVNLR